MTVEEIKKALAGGFQQMNTSRTEREPYEYDRNSDLIGMAYVSREWLDGQRPRKEWGWKTFIGLSLVFAGVVLWKVWVR